MSRAVDKALGHEPQVVGQRTDGRYAHGFSEEAKKALGGVVASESETGFSGEVGVITEAVTEEAARWEGWGTALKPAHEPIVVARKPLVGSVARNALEHGAGGLNIDGCRVRFQDEADEQESKRKNQHGEFDSGPRENTVYEADRRDRPNYDAPGRWPANVVLDPQAADMLDEQTGDLGKSAGGQIGKTSEQGGEVYEGGWASATKGDPGFGDRGGASRFFYVAKASRAERNAGLDGFEPKMLRWSSGDQSPGTFQAEGTDKTARNFHPTVKPIELMRWLVRLVTPPEGKVLDPFAGSGSTGCACALEGFEFVGVEQEPEFVKLAEARIEWWSQHPEGTEVEQALEGEAKRRKVAETGQLDMLTL